jgi:ABC-type branched-subunit amino acid transport system ATPase component
LTSATGSARVHGPLGGRQPEDRRSQRPIVDRLFDALIATAREDGTAVLLVEQARRALRVADRWYLLSRGVLAAKGNASDSDALWESYVS